MASEPDRLLDFFETTGLSPATLGESLADGSLEAALSHYVLGDEPFLIEMAAALACAPESLATALRRTGGTGKVESAP